MTLRHITLYEGGELGIVGRQEIMCVIGIQYKQVCQYQGLWLE